MSFFGLDNRLGMRIINLSSLNTLPRSMKIKSCKNKLQLDQLHLAVLQKIEKKWFNFLRFHATRALRKIYILAGKRVNAQSTHNKHLAYNNMAKKFATISLILCLQKLMHYFKSTVSNYLTYICRDR